jgi:hypothetical protein
VSFGRSSTSGSRSSRAHSCYLVALALKEDVDAIVTGDRDLLDADLTATSVWSPREARDRILKT